ncbi:mRNA export factor [Anaeramoeba ignava]|uniref:mRNA export factor n=1 Tax=Anaeramoeba ignava TaxID=1746090 RepID=A0A9Q0RIG3_ANAIG|nr:mRNA export factor [Anaeramoeba ignava]
MNQISIKDAPPQDSVSSLHFSPIDPFILEATSWDNFARIWQIDGSVAKIMLHLELQEPPLCSAWSADSRVLFIGGANNKVTAWDVSTNQQQDVAEHLAPIKEVFVVPEVDNLLITGGWDKAIRFWDLRQPNLVFEYTQIQKIFSMDVKYPLLVAADSQRKIYSFDITSTPSLYNTIDSPMKYQTRVVRIFNEKDGYAIGSIDGRVGINYLTDSSPSFQFRCHRNQKHEVFGINDISFHPKFGTFATVGSDGEFFFWCKNSRTRTSAGPHRYNKPITKCDFNNDGSLFAFSVCDDWHMGTPNSSLNTTDIYLYNPPESEVKDKPKK